MILYDEGVSHVFVSPGAHATALRDSLTDAETAGAPHPQPILCAHEQVAILAAHGHHLASAAPQAVIVSVEGPELNLGGAIHGAQRHRIPIAVFSSAGRGTPSTAAGKWTADPRVAAHLGGRRLV